ncbi:Bug family tripartite tricarboxylate transporter substrate binding protein [Paracraurococcus lichenis]|uniref:Tripartite tricarboxylate transporter substrate binding protein n=1 Tax=Paracraurococcus lichenis TaxID=3064888 RepID=A0ABT9E1V7_9PROT|nr:tripartite tricarboxylate transporter substrate binding protein [Paracraurococcus sp. LOR1-02]MDO9710147.1 tripartite tricarboxylate transporter substrate binding protein [Paracraurococcus sp. LOR1-02]
MRRLLQCFGAMLCLALGQAHPAAAADAWPAKPIRIVVVFPPGGSSDIVARVLAEAMTPKLGQRVVVDNRPGAGGTLAALHVAQQPADGYTLMLSNTAPIVTSPPLYAKPGYDPQSSFTHIAYIGATYMVVVTNTSVPATDLRSLMAWMKSQPAPVTYGTSGAGSVGHVVGSMFTQQTGIPLNHAPYRGSQPMQADLLGGSILLSFDTLPENVENIRAGRLRAHAITAPQRSASVPEVPTVAEAGLPDLLAQNWLGLSGPAGLPAPVVARLHAEVVAAAVRTPAVQERLATVGIVPGEMTQPEFERFVAGQIDTVGGMVKAMGIRND